MAKAFSDKMARYFSFTACFFAGFFCDAFKFFFFRNKENIVLPMLG